MHCEIITREPRCPNHNALRGFEKPKQIFTAVIEKPNPMSIIEDDEISEYDIGNDIKHYVFNSEALISDKYCSL